MLLVMLLRLMGRLAVFVKTFDALRVQEDHGPPCRVREDGGRLHGI